MGHTEYNKLRARDISEGINQGLFKAEEVVYYFLLRAKQSNKTYNCVTQFLYESALEKARKIDQRISEGYKYDLDKYPLLGVPISVKDTFHIKNHDSVVGFLKYLNKPLNFYFFTYLC